MSLADMGIITDYLRFLESAGAGLLRMNNDGQIVDDTGIVPFPLSDFPTDWPGESWRSQKSITVYTGSPERHAKFDPGGRPLTYGSPGTR